MRFLADSFADGVLADDILILPRPPINITKGRVIKKVRKQHCKN